MASSETSKTAKAMSKLTLDRSTSPKAKPKPTKETQPVADSWEDASSSSSDSEEAEPLSTSTNDKTSTPRQNSGFEAPPPTPSSPSYRNHSGSAPPWQQQQQTTARGSEAADDAPRRPEKTDAVARRMIASALGVKAPRPTEEQRAYDRALREKERKRKEEERAAERRRLVEAEKAKVAIWED
ncbi:Uu.00g019110.m01.CDS01 [Anthostomella pinea]|uniref:Uu.00g019110.m01.CDS01 n=1 Tax=Anthostomella pinea TaxID=933095 RepID=A0AAI8VZ91_9PEZI|nr:Uu.00g019110.m01.CDS01 [Anthostomella pinea]